ncbi:hypothetical protein [Cohaesibacter marisflavi]|nr:hypothetical protein [Cohaesibacter marisflavi]
MTFSFYWPEEMDRWALRYRDMLVDRGDWFARATLEILTMT